MARQLGAVNRGKVSRAAAETGESCVRVRSDVRGVSSLWHGAVSCWDACSAQMEEVQAELSQRVVAGALGGISRWV